MYTSADAAERRIIAEQNTSSSGSSTAASSSSGSSGSSSTVSSQAAAAVQSGDAQQVQTYVEQHPEEAEAVYQELLLTDPDLLYQIERSTSGSVPPLILAQYTATPFNGATGTSGPDLSAQMTEVTGKETPDEEVTALSEAAQEIEAQYGSTVATDFVADYIRSNPQAFAEGYVMSEQYYGGVAPESKQIFANALSQVYDSTPTAPYGYSSPYSFANKLIEGTFAGQEGFARTTMSELVALSGNEKLQADFVTAGLYRGNVAMVGNTSEYGYGQQSGQAMIQSLAPATAGSRDAAQAVVRFAENNRVGDSKDELQNKGVDSLRWILETFNGGFGTTNAQGDYQSGFITFLDAAVNGSGVSGLSDRESAELFFAIAGASTDGTGLLETDGPSGKSDPRATELTSQLYQTYFDRWMASPELRMQYEGQIAENGAAGTPLEGVDINGAFRTFFNEALLDPNEAGDYRAGLQQFMMGKVFEAMDPDSAFSKAVGPDAAAMLAGNLVGQLEGAEVDALRAFGAEAAADERTKERLLTMMFVVGVASGGAGWAVTAGSTAAKVLIAALVEAGKSGSRIAAEELVTQGVDEKTAEMVAGYANGDITLAEAFKGSSLFSDLADAGLSDEKLQAFEGWISTSVGDADFTLGEVIADGLAVLRSDVSPELSDRLTSFDGFFDDGLERQRQENAQ
jgi:hypothetical protein